MKPVHYKREKAQHTDISLKEFITVENISAFTNSKFDVSIFNPTVEFKALCQIMNLQAHS